MKKTAGCFILVVVAVLVGCTAKRAVNDGCTEKISAPLLHVVSQTQADTIRISVVVILHDSAGISLLFPMLSVPNARIALGHLTKEEISSLCKQKNVQYIDIPKMRFPNK